MYRMGHMARAKLWVTITFAVKLRPTKKLCQEQPLFFFDKVFVCFKQMGDLLVVEHKIIKPLDKQTQIIFSKLFKQSRLHSPIFLNLELNCNDNLRGTFSLLPMVCQAM